MFAAMQEVLYFLMKRGAPASLDYAVPINTTMTAQRFLCSRSKVKRIEILFPIRITNPAPSATLECEGKVERRIEFSGSFTNPSKAIFYADVDLTLDNKVLNFQITRDCCIAFFIEKEEG